MGVYACYDRICIDHSLYDVMYLLLLRIGHFFFAFNSVVRSYLFYFFIYRFQRFYLLLKAFRVSFLRGRSMLVLFLRTIFSEIS